MRPGILSLPIDLGSCSSIEVGIAFPEIDFVGSFLASLLLDNDYAAFTFN